MELVRFVVNWLELTICSKFFTLTKFCFTDHSPAENLVNLLISINECDSQLVLPIIKVVGQTKKIYWNILTCKLHVFREGHKISQIFEATKGQKISEKNLLSWILPKNERWGNFKYWKLPQRLFFGRIQDAIICFWDLLTFNQTSKNWENGFKFCCLLKISDKGQMISKCLYGVIVWTKKPTNFFPGFLP